MATEPVIGFGEVCRNHGISNPEDLDAALADYKMQAEQLRSYILHFGKAQAPHRSRTGDVWVCPKCGHRVHERHSYCQWCGKMLNEIRGMGRSEEDRQEKALASMHRRRKPHD